MSRAIGNFLVQLRKCAHLSRHDLALKLHIDPEEVRWWEEAGRLPDPDLLPQVAAYLKSSVEEFYFRSGWIATDLAKRLSDDGTLSVSNVDSQLKNQMYLHTHQVAPRPIFHTSGGALYQGDCISILETMESRSVDCIFADPPFNLGKDYGKTVNDDLGEDEYLAWAFRWLEQLVRVLRPGGALFLYNLPKWNIHLAVFLDRYLEFKHWIAIDIKFSLPITGRLYPSHYSLLYFVKGSKPRVFNPPRLPLQTCRHCGGEIRDYGGYKDKMNPRGVNLTDVWVDIPPVRHRRYKNRGANELSLKMLDRILDIATEKGDLILDPFAGSGTTLAACELKGRRWIGIEIGDCNPIMERLSSIEREQEQFKEIRSQINVLFTPDVLALRKRSGHDTSRYRVKEAVDDTDREKQTTRSQQGQIGLFGVGKQRRHGQETKEK